MGDKTTRVASRRFEIECIPWGYETKRERGLNVNAEPIRLETAVRVPEEPMNNLSTRLGGKAKRMAASIRRTETFKWCRFKRFLTDAQEVLLQTRVATSPVFAPDADGMIRCQAKWTRTIRTGIDWGDVDKVEVFTIPHIAGEDPVDTARRLRREIMEKGEEIAARAIDSDSLRSSVFDLNLEELALVTDAIALEAAEAEALHNKALAEMNTESYEYRGPRGFQP